MYELTLAAGNSFFLQCPAKIGLVRLDGGDVCLIDSGGDKDAAKKVRRLLDDNGWRLRSIYNTHSHADHIGGNKFLQDRTGCRIYAPGAELGFVRHPTLEPSLLYGGCPPDELRRKFLLAEPSDAEPLTPEVLPDGFEVIPLPGHFLDMVGFRTPDDVVYLADCLASRATLEKYGIAFVYDVGAHLETLEKVKTLRAKLFVPSHADAAEDVTALADLNIAATHDTSDRIERLLAEPTPFDLLLRRVFEEFSLAMTFEQHALIGSTVRSYLTWMKSLGRVTAELSDNTLLWRRA